MPPSARTTIRDVARHAGVSVTTVSRVLNGKGDVASATRERINRAIQDLGYASNLAARSLRGQPTNCVGVSVIDLSDSFSNAVVQGVSREANRLGFDCMVLSHARTRSASLAVQEQQHVNMLNGTLVDGLILVTPVSIQCRSQAPIVVLDPPCGSRFPLSVSSDNRGGMRMAVRALASAGHRHVGFVSGRSDLLCAQERHDAFVAELTAQGMEQRQEWVWEGDFTRESGRRAARTILAQSERPTALVCSNDQMALGVYEVARNQGVCIPRDLSLVGFDDIPEAAAARPALATVAQDAQAMGMQALNLLVRGLKGETVETCHVRLPVVWKARASVGPGPMQAGRRPMQER